MSWELPLAALLTFLAGVAAYALQKRLDRSEQIRARHFSIYVEMVEAICGLANATNRNGQGMEEALSEYATAKMKFAVVASEGAMKKFIAFDRKITSGRKVSNKDFDHLLAEFMREVRIENIGGTSLTNEELVVITPYGRSIREE